MSLQVWFWPRVQTATGAAVLVDVGAVPPTPLHGGAASVHIGRVPPVPPVCCGVGPAPPVGSNATHPGLPVSHVPGEPPLVDVSPPVAVEPPSDDAPPVVFAISTREAQPMARSKQRV